MSLPKTPIKVCITGAAGAIGGYAAFMVAQGVMLGQDQPIELRLLEVPEAEKALQGMIMELKDGAFPLLTSIVGTSDYKTAFDGVEIAMLIGAKPRGPGMERVDLMRANAAIFKGQGKALDQYASRNVKVVVVGNPANTNCLIAMTNAPGLSPSCFSAMTRLDQNRAVSSLAERLNVPVSHVRNVVIWGNHSATMYADVAPAYVTNFPSAGVQTSIRSAVNDDVWLDTVFRKAVATRGTAIINARGKSSAASAANAAIDHMRTWCQGTRPGEIASMGILSDGSYSVPKGIVYSFPVTVCPRGNVSIVHGFPVSSSAKEAMRVTADELLSERVDALGAPLPAKM